MCLQRIIGLPKYDEKYHGYNIGYKIFIKKDGYYYNMFYSCREFSLGEWVSNTEEIKRIRINIRRTYKAGFHVFLKLEDAKRWFESWMFNISDLVCVKVRYRQVNCYGKQDGFDCITVQEMKLIEEV